MSARDNVTRVLANEGTCQSTKMRQPGIEPGSTAWKAAMLTTIPLTLVTNTVQHKNYQLFQIHSCHLKGKKSHCRDQDSNLGYCGHNAGS